MSEPAGWRFQEFHPPGEGAIFGVQNVAPFTVIRCPVCLEPSTIIAGDYVAIADLALSGATIDHNGDRDRILDKFTRRTEGFLIEVKGLGLLPLQATREHPFLVVSRREIDWEGCSKFSEYGWKKASDLMPVRAHEPGAFGLDEDYLVMPRPRGFIADKILGLSPFTNCTGLNAAKGRGLDKLKLDAETAWMMGYYVAEGFATSKAVYFTIGTRDEPCRSKLVAIGTRLGYMPGYRRLRTASYVSYESRLLARAFREWFGRGAHNKRIPDFLLFNVDQEVIDNFFRGYWIGDGYVIKARRFEAGTTSRILASQLQLMAARLGYFLAIRMGHRAPIHMIEGRLVHQRPYYSLSYFINPRKLRSRVREHDILVPIRETRTVPYSGQVYNLETSTGTYLANNIVVHNCGQLVWVPRGHFDTTHDCTILCPYSGDTMYPIPADPSQAKDLGGNPIRLLTQAATELVEWWKRYFRYCPNPTCSYIKQWKVAYMQQRVETEIQVGR
jgi:hypothetical protein